jgi:hypothetical protein
MSQSIEPQATAQVLVLDPGQFGPIEATAPLSGLM